MTHTKRILISSDPQEVRVAIVEGGKLSEAYIERRGRRSIAGNIYKGRVDAVLPGMEAAFVDIGLEKNGFLYVDEIVMPDLDERERRRKPIQDLIRAGEELLVQVVKDPMGTKGARLTMEVSLAGRFMVLQPGQEGVGVSRRLGDAERDRLRDLVKSMQTERDAGMIVRTAAEGASIEELERDVRLLEKLWETTRGHAERSEAPALVYVEPDLSLQMIRDDLRSDVSEVVVDDERQYHRIASYVRRTSPDLIERVKLYKGKRPLFQRYEIEQGIRSTLRRRVDLPSGGYLIFDYAEAFTIVDVNTGRFTGKSKRLEDTILHNNLEAAVELVRQLRLRDVGGIIVVDFIDMANQKNRDAVLKALQKELEKDRTKVYVVEISPLGLVEMTRKNVADGVREIMTHTCPSCDGTGRVLSEETVAIDNLRELRRHVKESKAEAFHVALNPAVAAAMIGPGGSRQREFEEETGRFFAFEGVDNAPLELCEVRAEGTRDEIERAAIPVQEGDEVELLIDEPHMYVEADAVGRLESGYVVVVAGSGPYVGQRHKVRIERATRFSAYATLVDAPPITDHGPVDKESDILEPERQIGERVDVEGRMRRQRRRGGGGGGSGGGGGGGGGGGQRSDRRKTAGANGAKPPVTEEAVAASLPEPDELTGVPVSASDAEDADKDADAAAKRRRRRRGGRGRGRKPAVNGAAETDAASEDVETPVVVGGPAHEDDDGTPGESTAAKRRRRRRRRTTGEGGEGGDAPVTGEARPVEAAEPVSAAAGAPRTRNRRPAPPRESSEAPAPAPRPPAPAPAPAQEPAKSGGLLGRLFGRREP